MDVLRPVVNMILLFIEVFLVVMTMLFLIGCVMSTPWAWFGFVFAVGGLIYAIWKQNLDLLDRYFYYIIGLVFTYILTFIDVNL